MSTKRRGEIVKLLNRQGIMSVGDLSAALGVSDETVRRDARALAESGLVVRVHGSVALAGQTGEAPFDRRMRENAAAKQEIAASVAAMIADGDSLMLDTGSTTSFVARALLQHRRLTIVTNSSDIARTLATVNGNRVFMAGGELRGDSGAALGAAALAFVRGFAVQYAIISAGAVDVQGVMDFDMQEAEFARSVLECGQTRLLVTESAKFARRGLVRVAGLEAIHRMITDQAPPEPLMQALAAAGTELQIARSGAGPA